MKLKTIFVTELSHGLLQSIYPYFLLVFAFLMMGFILVGLSPYMAITMFFMSIAVLLWWGIRFFGNYVSFNTENVDLYRNFQHVESFSISTIQYVIHTRKNFEGTSRYHDITSSADRLVVYDSNKYVLFDVTDSVLARRFFEEQLKIIIMPDLGGF